MVSFPCVFNIWANGSRTAVQRAGEYKSQRVLKQNLAGEKEIAGGLETRRPGQLQTHTGCGNVPAGVVLRDKRICLANAPYTAGL
jgi:hypothetical protein